MLLFTVPRKISARTLCDMDEVLANVKATTSPVPVDLFGPPPLKGKKDEADRKGRSKRV